MAKILLAFLLNESGSVRNLEVFVLGGPRHQFDKGLKPGTLTPSKLQLARTRLSDSHQAQKTQIGAGRLKADEAIHIINTEVGLTTNSSTCSPAPESHIRP